MKLLSCLHPNVVFNQSLGRKVVVPCGRCEACLNVRSASWVQRLEQERYFSPYTFFVTFQYDELHVNQYIRLRDEDNPNYPIPSYIDSSTGVIVSLSDVPNYTQKDIQYCNETKVLLVPSVRDFQLFMKSLRKDISNLYGKSTKIRFFCAFEIGPTTYRPHAHCLFFFDSTLLSQNFGELCRSHWHYGCVFDPHPVTGNASQYVASYVTSFAHLPAIYLSKEIRPKALFSKRPPIGYRALSQSSRKETFFKGKDSFTIFKQTSHTFCDVPLWRFFRNSLYRFIVKFGKLSYLDRVSLYRIGSLFQCPFGENIAIRECIRLGYYKNFYTKVKGSLYFRYNEDSFQRFKRCVSAAFLFCKEMNISIEYYVYLLSVYYDSCAFKQLENYFRAQDEYFRYHPVSDWLLLDVDFVRSVNNKFYDDLSSGKKFYLDMYFPSLDKSKLIHLDIKKSFFYDELNKLHHKIYFDSTKTKENTDYLMAHANEFQNIINFKLT